MTNLMRARRDPGLQSTPRSVPSRADVFDGYEGVAEGPDPGLDWGRIFGAVKRFKWLILLATALGTVAGIAATSLVSPEYLVQTTIWIDGADRAGSSGERGPIREGKLLDTEAWVDLLKSYVVLDQVTRDRHQFLGSVSPSDTTALGGVQVDEPYAAGDYRLKVDAGGRLWVLSTKAGVEVDRGVVGDSVGSQIGMRWAPSAAVLTPGRNLDFSLVPVRDASRSLAERLNVRIDENGNFLRVEMLGTEPREMAATLNAVAQRYVEVAASLKKEKLIELTRILEGQVDYAQGSLRDAEAALQRFRVTTITMPSDGGVGGGAVSRDPALSGYFDIKITRDQVERDRKAILRLLASSGTGRLPPDALGSIGAVQRSAELSHALQELTGKQAEVRALRYRYSDEYPVVRRLAGEIDELELRTIPAMARSLTSELSTRAAEFDRQLGPTSQELRRIPTRDLDEARLRRSVALAENLYTSLQGRFDEARLAEASTVPDVRILDAAVPPRRPFKDAAQKLILLALCGSFGLSLVGAVLVDRFDPRVRYAEQVSRELGLPILGAIPHLQSPDAKEAVEVVETMRGLCLSLMHALATPGAPLVLTISSPGAGDGKSFLAANLALSFAQAGHRTLLIDGDVRRGILHRRFKINRKPGLTDHLRGSVPLEVAVQHAAYPHLAVMGCGTRAHRGPELLGSPAMQRMLEDAREDYDVILVDSPPLGAGVDAFVLGTVTGNLLLVLRTGVSHRDVAESKLEVLGRLPVRIVGAVLNDMPQGSSYRYYSYYMPGYETVEEPEESGTEVMVLPRIV